MGKSVRKKVAAYSTEFKVINIWLVCDILPNDINNVMYIKR